MDVQQVIDCIHKLTDDVVANQETLLKRSRASVASNATYGISDPWLAIKIQRDQGYLDGYNQALQDVLRAIEARFPK